MMNYRLLLLLATFGAKPLPLCCATRLFCPQKRRPESLILKAQQQPIPSVYCRMRYFLRPVAFYFCTKPKCQIHIDAAKFNQDLCGGFLSA